MRLSANLTEGREYVPCRDECLQYLSGHDWKELQTLARIAPELWSRLEGMEGFHEILETKKLAHELMKEIDRRENMHISEELDDRCYDFAPAPTDALRQSTLEFFITHPEETADEELGKFIREYADGNMRKGDRTDEKRHDNRPAGKLLRIHD